MWTGNVSPVIRQKAKGSRPARNLARRAARRVILTGYPVEPRPMSLAEVENYFKGDKMVCLRCGKPYRKPGVHLLNIHSLTVDDYRGLYGLPWTKGLAGEQTKALHAANALATIAAGKDFGSAAHRAKAHKTPRRKAQPFFRELAMRNSGVVEWPPETFDRLLEELRAGSLPYEALSKEGMPGRTWLGVYLKKNPEADARFRSLFDEMPFDWQRRTTLGMGPRFWSEVRRLRDAGGSDRTIARDLGVTAMTINLGRRKRRIA